MLAAASTGSASSFIGELKLADPCIPNLVLETVEPLGGGIGKKGRM